jgi:hypothetical protein
MTKDKDNREETPVGNPAREKTARNAKAQASLIASAEPPTKVSLSMTLPLSHILTPCPFHSRLLPRPLERPLELAAQRRQMDGSTLL